MHCAFERAAESCGGEWQSFDLHAVWLVLASLPVDEKVKNKKKKTRKSLIIKQTKVSDTIRDIK